MNKYGLVLNEIGMEPLFDQLQRKVLDRISAHTTHYLLLTTHYSLLTTHYSLLTTHYSLLTTY